MHIINYRTFIIPIPRMAFRFPDPTLEGQYRAFVRDSFVERSRPFLGIHLLSTLTLNITAAAVAFFSEGKEDDMNVAGISFRLLGTATLAGFYCSRWSESWKPKIARIYHWMARLFWLVAAAMEFGILKQPDSHVKVGLLWYLYWDSVMISTFEEYLCCAVVLAYLELMRLLLWGGPCPVDLSRPCTTYELWTHFAYHTLYLGVASWIHHYTHSERRRDFACLNRSRRTPATFQHSTKSSLTRLDDQQ